MVAIFFPGRAHVPLDFPGQIPTSPISSALQWSLFMFFLILHHFPVVSPVVPLRCVSPGRRLQLLTVQPFLSSEALGASNSKRLPGETQRVP